MPWRVRRSPCPMAAPMSKLLSEVILIFLRLQQSQLVLADPISSLAGFRPALCLCLQTRGPQLTIISISQPKILPADIFMHIWGGFSHKRGVMYEIA